MQEVLSPDIVTAIGAATLIVALLVSTLILRGRTPSSSSSSQSPSSSSTNKQTTTKVKNDGRTNETTQESLVDSKIDDVWAERQSKGVAPASLHHRSDAGKGKPFGSSYYYAHHSASNAKGGYSDGLRMEDYTMNQPRLLSRGGQPVTASTQAETKQQQQDSVNTSSDAEATAVPSDQKSNNDNTVGRKRTLPITKYLWDDPGDSNGQATIRIDRLPGTTQGSETIEWKDGGVVDVNGELLDGGDGLLVTIETEKEVDYEIRIKKLYGTVAEIKTIVKANKRLLVRLKKKTGFLSKNTKPWPQPHQKIH